MCYERMSTNGNMPAIAASAPDGSAYATALITPPMTTRMPTTFDVFMVVQFDFDNLQFYVSKLVISDRDLERIRGRFIWQLH